MATEDFSASVNLPKEFPNLLLNLRYITHSGFGPSTKLYMGDGSIREIRDVAVGDFVVGDDGIPRRVLKKFTGHAPMYLVHQNNGATYVVTGNQNLVLRATGVGSFIRTITKLSMYEFVYYRKCIGGLCRKGDCPGTGFRMKSLRFKSENEANEAQRVLLSGQFDPNWVREGDLFIMTLEQYFEICNHTVRTNCLQCYKSLLPIFKPSDDLPLDPYYVGIWLGDGSKDDSIITSSDPEIEEYLETLESDDIVLDKYISHKPGDVDNSGVTRTKFCYKFRLRNVTQRGANPILRKLKDLDIYMNKHIPDIYMNASEENRYRLLAGLLDTDGSLNAVDCHYRFTQSERNKGIVYQVQTLARTLGITANEIFCEDQPPIGRETYKDGKRFHTRYIEGLTGANTLRIPCLIERKKASVRCADHSFNTNNVSRITIHPIIRNQGPGDGIGEYVGIAVDGNDRFILSDCTVVAGSI